MSIGNNEENGAVSQEWAALETAIEALYEDFAAYPLRPVIDGRPHCVSREDSDQLHVRPLRELTPDDVLYHTPKAMSWSKAARARFEVWLQDDDTVTMLGLAALESRAGDYTSQFSPDIEAALTGLVAD
jgi:hypothetical protein